MTLDEQKPTPDLTDLLNQLWMRFLPDIHERVAILETAAQARAAGEITPEQREAAHAAAHKLAGSLGTFGLARGSELAREFEHMCDSEDACSSAQNMQLAALAAEIRTIIETRR
jgi:HPt (histidine-containing phosphotransfer) domain-containing protein